MCRYALCRMHPVDVRRIAAMSEDAVRIPVEGGDDPPRQPWLPPWLPILVVVLLIGMGVVWTAVSQDSTPSTSAAPLLIESPSTLGTTPVTSTSSTSLAFVSSTTEPNSSSAITVTLRDGATVLEGEVALTPEPGMLGGGTLWVLGPGGSIERMDGVPFWPGDYPYPMLMTGGHVMFTNLTDGYLIDAELTELPDPLTEASFIIPGATAGLVWFVGPGVDWVAPVDAKSRAVGEQYDVSDVFWWPVAGVSDGLIVNPIDEVSYGRFAYWSPSEGLQRLDLRVPQHEYVLAASGNVAVAVSPDEVSILNILSGDYLSAFRIEFSRSVLSTVCLSPDQQHLAMVGSNGEAFLGHTDDGSFIELPAGIHGWKSIGWTSDTQLVYIIDIDDETLIQSFDITTGATYDIATLQSFRRWMLTASGSMC